MTGHHPEYVRPEQAAATRQSLVEPIGDKQVNLSEDSANRLEQKFWNLVPDDLEHFGDLVVRDALRKDFICEYTELGEEPPEILIQGAVSIPVNFYRVAIGGMRSMMGPDRGKNSLGDRAVRSASR